MNRYIIEHDDDMKKVSDFMFLEITNNIIDCLNQTNINEYRLSDMLNILFERLNTFINTINYFKSNTKLIINVYIIKIYYRNTKKNFEKIISLLNAKKFNSDNLRCKIENIKHYINICNEKLTILE